MRSQNSTKRFTTFAVLSATAVAGTLFVRCGGKSGSTTSSTTTPPSESPAVASVLPQPVPPPLVVPNAAETKSAWREGVALYEAGDRTGAVEQLRVAVAGRPDDAYAHYLLGLSLLKAGQLESAEESLVRSSELNGDSDRTWINLARVRMERDDFEGALHAAETALTLSPESSSALHQRGRAEAALGRLDEAIETLKSASSADPENGYVANTLGYVLIQRGRPEEAIAPLEIARQKLSGVAYVHNNLGVAYERTGRIEDAAGEYRAAIESGDSEGKAAQSLARLTPLLPEESVAKKQDPVPNEEVASSSEPR